MTLRYEKYLFFWKEIQTIEKGKRMSTNQKAMEKVDATIAAAAKKVNAKKENDICRYLPGPKGGYIHHFSMRKMRHEDPEGLIQILTKHIISPSNPTKLPPKPRAPRGSRKKRDHLPLTKQEIDLIVLLAKQSGQKDIIRKLAPRKDLRSIKRELIASIKHGQIKEELWIAYTETVGVNNQVLPSQFSFAPNGKEALAAAFN